MSYPLAPLNRVLRRSADEVRVEPTETYRTAGIYSFGRGLFERPPIIGAETSYRSYFRLHEGQFVYSKLFAWEGAVAVVGRAFDGLLVSSEFPTFDIESDVALPAYVAALCRWPEFHEAIASGRTGLGVRRQRVNPDRLLDVEIPLPDLAEQRRIASRLDSLLRRVTGGLVRSDTARKEADALGWALLRTEFETLRARFGTVLLPSVVEINPETIAPEREFGSERFRYVDIGSIENGAGRIAQPSDIIGVEAPSRARRRIRAGDVLVSTVRPNLRGVALVPEELDEQVCSTGFAVLRPRGELTSRFLLYQAMSDTVVDQLVEATTGGHYPAVSDRRLRTVQVVCPPLEVQQVTVDQVERSLMLTRAAADRIHSQGTALASLEASILNHAFAGQL